jgi:N utilization substance protein B
MSSSTKSLSRLASLQALYQFEISEDNLTPEQLAYEIANSYNDGSISREYEEQDPANTGSEKLKFNKEYLKQLIHYTLLAKNSADEEISKFLSEGWEVSKLGIINRNILRLALTEFKYFPEVPRKVVINEYTSIAAEFLSENEVGFINSVLDNYITSLAS